MKPVRLGVIGSINQDTIWQPNQGPRRSLGGVLYTVGALAHLAQGAVEIWLLGRLGRNIAPEVLDLLKGWPGLRLEGLQVVDSPAFHSHIRYFPDGSKEERLEGDIAPLEWRDLAPFSAALDGLLVNFITGFEVRREALETARQQGLGPVLMDIHSLTLGRRRDGRRYWRCPADWQRWVGLADWLQMNEAEAALLGGGEALQHFAARLLRLGPSGVALTLGAEGVLGASSRPDGPHYFRRPATPGPVVDPTGCGDVFLAGLAAGWARGVELEEAVAQANRAAGINCRLAGLDQLQCLANEAGD